MLECLAIMWFIGLRGYWIYLYLVIAIESDVVGVTKLTRIKP